MRAAEEAARAEAANRVEARAENEAAQGSGESRNSEGSRGSGTSRSEGSDSKASGSKASSIASKATATAISRDKLRPSRPQGKTRVGTLKFDMAKGERTKNDVCNDKTEDGSDLRRPQQKRGEAMGRGD